MPLGANQYYVGENQQILPMYDKSKKTWSERLKITKAEKYTSPLEGISNCPPSALQRSMRYAEPWIYGTVRGIPARPVHGQSIFGPMPTEVAVVVCSCPEYLTGTKREVKKASICKKCRGSRLPLAPIGGTVRARPTIVPAMHKSRGNFGTMRLPSLSSVKSRPSILDPQSDPYDLMRRSRLLSPELKQADILVKPLKNRAKSTSPNRGRSRNTIPTAISIEDVALSKDSRSRSASRSKQDRWLDTLEPDPGGRRSILHCNVNPYDLISQTGIKHNNEFAPDHDDLFNSEQLKIIPRRQVEFINYSNSLNIAGQRISMGNSPKELLVSENNYTNLSVIKNKKEGFTQQELKQAKNNSNKKEAASEISKPKRPPRRKQEASFDNETADVHSKALTISSNCIITPSSIHITADRVTSQKQGIKSILKRPSSVTSSISSSSDTDVKCSSDNHTNAVTNNDKKSVESNAIAEPQSRDDNKTRLKFFLPFPPARKKVQFMVENKIIHNEQEDEKGISKDSASVGSGNVNSNYDKVQKQQDNKMQQILDTFQESTEVKKICENDAKINEIKKGSKIVFKGGKVPGTPIVGGSRNTSDSCSDVHKTSDKTLGASSELSPVQGAKDISAALSSPPSRRTYYSLRRVNSDRRSNTTTISLNFNDTMALRAKSSRTDCRDLFANDVAQNLIGIKSAEDSLPSHLSDSTASLLSTNELIAQVNVNNDKTQAKGLGHERQTEELEQEPQSPYQANKNISWQENGTIMIKNCPENYSSSEDERDKENSKSESTSESYNLKIDPNINVISFKKKNFKKQQDNKKVEKEKLLQAQTEINNGARLFGNQINTSQKTIVRVAPFNKTPAEIHRLKISHKDDSQIDSSNQRKTSILINGDDCYSTVNVSNDTSLYQSSVVVADGTNHITNNIAKVVANTVTINVSHSRTSEEEIIYKNNKINTLLNLDPSCKAVIPIRGEDENFLKESDDAKGTKRGRTLITLDTLEDKQTNNAFSHEEELVKILRNPVEAVRRNLVPHVCGRPGQEESLKSQNVCGFLSLKHEGNSFIEKLLEDPTLSHLAEGLDSEVVIKLIENSLKRLKHNRSSLDTSGTKDNDDMSKLINMSLQKVKEERLRLETVKKQQSITPDEQESRSNRGSVSSANSFSSANYELFDFENNESDCYQSCSSEIAGDEDINSTRNKFYQMLVDATLSEIEISTTIDDDHHYESIRLNGDPIYEEISDVPPPLPLSPPPLTDHELEKKNTRSMFEGATKYDILSYLVDAKERGIVKEDAYEYNFGNSSNIIVEEEVDTLADLSKKQNLDVTSRMSHLSVTSDSSEDNSLTSTMYEKMVNNRKITSDIERNDSGVGSETSKSSRSKFQNGHGCPMHKNSPIHICEDCDGPVETQITDSGVMYAPLVCRKCGKKRAERKEIITEIVETEEKYGRDLQIILEEFCQPMLVAGLLTQEQLSAIFLNTEELLENNQTLAERMRDALDIALDQGDDDLITVNIGKIFLEATPMLHAFETYCVRQASASLLLANLEKEKELLRIFLRVSQMENTVLRRMNLNSFLMVPVQRVTKYPLLLARLYKVTPSHLEGRTLLKQAQEKIELHLNHMNQETKDVPTKLWRRISSSSPNRRSSCEIDMINIKLRKMAIDLLEWNHDEVRFAIEGKLLFTQPTDNNWKKGRTIKLTPVNALLVTNGKPSANYKAEKALSNQLNFPKHTGIREASLLLVREKCGRYTLIREPLYMDRCVVCTEADWDDYFEVHEISSKDTFIFKAEDGVRTKQWYTQLQYHAQGMGAWRKRRNALANIMINGMLSRT